MCFANLGRFSEAERLLLLVLTSCNDPEDSQVLFARRMFVGVMHSMGQSLSVQERFAIFVQILIEFHAVIGCSKMNEAFISIINRYRGVMPLEFRVLFVPFFSSSEESQLEL